MDEVIRKLSEYLEVKATKRPEGYTQTPFCPYRVRISQKQELFLGENGFMLERNDLNFPGTFLVSICEPWRPLGLLNRVNLDVGFDVYGVGVPRDESNLGQQLRSNTRLGEILQKLSQLEHFFFN